MNYLAIYEVNNDIINFKLKAINNTDLQSLMQQASNITSRIREAIAAAKKMVEVKRVWCECVRNGQSINTLKEKGIKFLQIN